MNAYASHVLQPCGQSGAASSTNHESAVASAFGQACFWRATRAHEFDELCDHRRYILSNFVYELVFACYKDNTLSESFGSKIWGVGRMGPVPILNEIISKRKVSIILVTYTPLGRWCFFMKGESKMCLNVTERVRTRCIITNFGIFFDFGHVVDRQTGHPNVSENFVQLISIGCYFLQLAEH